MSQHITYHMMSLSHIHLSFRVHQKSNKVGSKWERQLPSIHERLNKSTLFSHTCCVLLEYRFKCKMCVFFTKICLSKKYIGVAPNIAITSSHSFLTHICLL